MSAAQTDVPATPKPAPGTAPLPAPIPALWGENAPHHFDAALPWWVKSLIVATAVVIALLFLDQHIAVFAHAHPIPDLSRAADPLHPSRYGDAGRELMFLEQWGQGVCSVLVILAVAFIDPAGRRRALSMALGCILTLIVCHLLKDLCGRSRPFVYNPDGSFDGAWRFGGPAMGFTKGSAWGSFPSAHTTGAFALAAGLAWFYPRARALFMTLALITATLRVLHTAHYLSDVLAGMAIGVMVMRCTLSTRLAGRLIALAPPPVRAWWLQDLTAS